MPDREKIITQLEFTLDYHRFAGNNITADIVADALALLKEQEQIVRCKDCKHWNGSDHDCNAKAGYFHCSSDYYCADGKRRDDDDGSREGYCST